MVESVYQMVHEFLLEKLRASSKLSDRFIPQSNFRDENSSVPNYEFE